TTVSPRRTVALPSAWRAMRPVSMTMLCSPTGISRVSILFLFFSFLLTTATAHTRGRGDAGDLSGKASATGALPALPAWNRRLCGVRCGRPLLADPETLDGGAVAAPVLA